MILREILRVKGSAVHTISPDATLGDVVAKLVEQRVGSLVVLDQERMIGIVTERDILRACSQTERPLKEVPLQEFMTSELMTAKPDDRVEDIMGLMTDKRIRHLPVLEGDQLIGIISIGDVVKAQHDQLTVENEYLRNYIQS